MKRTILFITPTLARTGSEVALVNLLCSADLRQLRAIVFIYGGRGELANALPESIRVLHLPFSALLARNKLINYVSKKIFAPLMLWLVTRYFNPDLFYINTITVPWAMALANSRGIPVILHIHELEQMFSVLSEVETQKMIFQPTHIIAASNRVAQMVRTFGRDKDVSVIHSTINHAPDSSRFSRSEPRFQPYHKKKQPFLWIMAGTLDTNKDPVRFVRIAKKYLMHRKEDHFIWLGSGSSGYALYARKLSKDLGIESSIQWLTAENHFEYLNTFKSGDGFLLTSAAESLSLVAIEALSFGKPVVSFDNGGSAELLDNRTGIIIPQFDIDKCVRAMLDIANGKKRFNSKVLQNRASAFHTSEKSPHWANLVCSVLQ